MSHGSWVPSVLEEVGNWAVGLGSGDWIYQGHAPVQIRRDLHSM